MSHINRLGEKRIMSNGQNAEITAYHAYNDIVVKFEDGFETKTRYDHFKSGNVRNPGKLPIFRRRKETGLKGASTKVENQRNLRLGEKRVMANGLEAVICEYRNASDIDILFEDGVIIKHKSYANFRKGYCRHPNHKGVTSVKRSKDNANTVIGQTNKANNGMDMTVIAYRSNTDIDVRFEDGSVREHVRYSNFKAGSILPEEDDVRSKKIGSTCKAKDGSVVTLVEWNGCSDLTVRFEDGTLKSGVHSSQFKDGKLVRPSDNQRNKWKEHIGEQRQATSGLFMTLIGGETSRDVSVLFEDGTTVEHVRVRYFLSGSIVNPNFDVGPTRMNTKNFNGFTIIRYAFRLNDGRVYYEVADAKGERLLMTPQKMLSQAIDNAI